MREATYIAAEANSADSDGVDAPSRRHRNVPISDPDHLREEASYGGGFSIIGIDLAKRSFQVHGAKADGSVAYRKKLSRGKVLSFSPHSRVASGDGGAEAAPITGAGIVTLGHEVRLVPPIYVKAFVKRQKKDTDDPPESGRSPRWRWRRLRRRWRASGADATSRPASASCRHSTRPAAS